MRTAYYSKVFSIWILAYKLCFLHQAQVFFITLHFSHVAIIVLLFQTLRMKSGNSKNRVEGLRRGTSYIFASGNFMEYPFGVFKLGSWPLSIVRHMGTFQFMRHMCCENFRPQLGYHFASCISFSGFCTFALAFGTGTGWTVFMHITCGRYF